MSRPCETTTQNGSPKDQGSATGEGQSNFDLSNSIVDGDINNKEPMKMNQLLLNTSNCSSVSDPGSDRSRSIHESVPPQSLSHKDHFPSPSLEYTPSSMDENTPDPSAPPDSEEGTTPLDQVLLKMKDQSPSSFSINFTPIPPVRLNFATLTNTKECNICRTSPAQGAAHVRVLKDLKRTLQGKQLSGVAQAVSARRDGAYDDNISCSVAAVERLLSFSHSATVGSKRCLVAYDDDGNIEIIEAGQHNPTNLVFSDCHDYIYDTENMQLPTPLSPFVSHLQTENDGVEQASHVEEPYKRSSVGVKEEKDGDVSENGIRIQNESTQPISTLQESVNETVDESIKLVPTSDTLNANDGNKINKDDSDDNELEALVQEMSWQEKLPEWLTSSSERAIHEVKISPSKGDGAPCMTEEEAGRELTIGYVHLSESQIECSTATTTIQPSPTMESNGEKYTYPTEKILDTIATSICSSNEEPSEQGDDYIQDNDRKANLVQEVHSLSPGHGLSKPTTTITTEGITISSGKLQTYECEELGRDDKDSFPSSGAVLAITPFKKTEAYATKMCRDDDSSPTSTMSPGSPVGADFREMVSEATACATPFVRMTESPTKLDMIHSTNNAQSSSTANQEPDSHFTPSVSASSSLPYPDEDSTNETPFKSFSTPMIHLPGEAALVTPQVVPTTASTCDSDLAPQSSPLPSGGSKSTSSLSHDDHGTVSVSDSCDDEVLLSNTPRTRRILEWLVPDAVDPVTWPVPTMATAPKSTNTPEKMPTTASGNAEEVNDATPEKMSTTASGNAVEVNDGRSSPPLGKAPQQFLPRQQNSRNAIPDWWVPRVRPPGAGSSGSASSPLSLPSLLGASSYNEVSDLESPMFLMRQPFTYKFSEEESDIESQSTRINHEVVLDQASDICSSGGNETIASSMQNSTSVIEPSLQSMMSAPGYPLDEERSVTPFHPTTKVIDDTLHARNVSIGSSNSISCHTNDPNATMIISNVNGNNIDRSDNVDLRIDGHIIHSCPHKIRDEKGSDCDLEAAGTFDTLSPSVSSSSRRIDQETYKKPPGIKRWSCSVIMLFILLIGGSISLAVVFTRPGATSQEQQENHSGQGDETPEVKVSERPSQFPTLSPTVPKIDASNAPTPMSWNLTAPPITSPSTAAPQGGIMTESPVDIASWDRVEEAEDILSATIDGSFDSSLPKWYSTTAFADNDSGTALGTHGIDFKVVTAAEGGYLPQLRRAVNDYSSSRAVASFDLTTNSYQDLCEPEVGSILVCNGDFGDTDWKGSTVLFLRDKWIVAATIRINSSQMDSNSTALLQYTMCHQLGHALGLPHRSSGSCLQDFGTAFVDEAVISRQQQHPNEADLDYLVSLYGTAPTRQRRALREGEIK